MKLEQYTEKPKWSEDYVLTKTTAFAQRPEPEALAEQLVRLGACDNDSECYYNEETTKEWRLAGFTPAYCRAVEREFFKLCPITEER